MPGENRKINIECSFSPDAAEILSSLGASIAIAAPSVDLIILLSSGENDRLSQLVRRFPAPRTIAANESEIAISCRSEVIKLKNSSELSGKYPPKPGFYDALYLPRAQYLTGEIEISALDFVDEKIVASSALYSCLCEINSEHSFVPLWKPPFIGEINPGRSCYLSGFAALDGEIKYATAFAESCEPDAWRGDRIDSGVLTSVPDGKVLLRGIALPNCPVIADGRLFMLLSGTGEFVEIDMRTHKYETLAFLPGFATKFAIAGNYAFIAFSKIDDSENPLSQIPIMERSFAGVLIFDINKREIAGEIRWRDEIGEIADLALIPYKKPNLLNREKAESLPATVFPGGGGFGATDGENRTFSRGATTAQNLLESASGVLFDKFAKTIKFIDNDKIFFYIGDVRKNKTVGALIAEMKPEFKVAELGSIFVLPEQRRKGVAGGLLREFERIARNYGYTALSANIQTNWESYDIVKKLFRSQNWLEPEKIFANYKIKNEFDESNLFLAKKIRLPEEYEIFPWKELTAADREYIAGRQEAENWFYPGLTPFQNEDKIFGDASVGLRRRGKVAGWFIAHRFMEDYLQINCIFVDEESRKNGASIVFWAEAAKKLVATNIPHLTYQIAYNDVKKSETHRALSDTYSKVDEFETEFCAKKLKA